MKAWQKGWIFFLIMTGWVGRAWGDDYTCRRVREGQNRKAFWFTVQTKEEARKALLQYQEKLWKETVEQGWEGTAAGLKNAFYWLEKRGLLDCETKLEVIRRDLEFYNQHPDLLLGTYPWSVAGLPCARNWLKKELQRKDVSRLYHAWLIVEASRVWYEPYRDSLLTLIQERNQNGLNPDFVAYAIEAIPPEDTAKETIDLLVEVVLDSSYYVVQKMPPPEPGRVRKVDPEKREHPFADWVSDTIVHIYTAQEVAFHKLEEICGQSCIPPEIWDAFQKFRREYYRRILEFGQEDVVFDVMTYFPKFGHVTETDPDGQPYEAWFAVWRRVIGNVLGIPYQKIWLGEQEREGVGGWYNPGSSVIFVTRRVAEGPGTQYGVGEPYNGIDLMGVVVRHEWFGHKRYFDLVWRPLLMETGGTLDSLLRIYDRDGDLLMDSLETAGFTLTNGVIFRSNPRNPSSAKFEGIPMPYDPSRRGGGDSEVLANLEGCLWKPDGELAAAGQDWSRDGKNRYRPFSVDVLEDSTIRVILPVRDPDRRWVLTKEDLVLQAEAKDTNVQKIRWRITLNNEIQELFTRPGEATYLHVDTLSSDPEFYGIKWITAHGVARLCLLAHTPEQGEQGVPVTSPVLLAFSHPMDTASVHTGTIHERIYIPSLNA